MLRTARLFINNRCKPSLFFSQHGCVCLFVVPNNGERRNHANLELYAVLLARKQQEPSIRCSPKLDSERIQYYLVRNNTTPVCERRKPRRRQPVVSIPVSDREIRVHGRPAISRMPFYVAMFAHTQHSKNGCMFRLVGAVVQTEWHTVAW